MTICCPPLDVPLWSVSEGFRTESRRGLGERLDSDWDRETTDGPVAWLTGTREEEDEGCWLLLWLVNNRETKECSVNNLFLTTHHKNVHQCMEKQPSVHRDECI